MAHALVSGAVKQKYAVLFKRTGVPSFALGEESTIALDAASLAMAMHLPLQILLDIFSNGALAGTLADLSDVCTREPVCEANLMAAQEDMGKQVVSNEKMSSATRCGNPAVEVARHVSDRSIPYQEVKIDIRCDR